MKKFLMTAIAVLVLSGTAVATESVVMVNNNVVTVQSGNVFDKIIAMVRGYIKKIDAILDPENFDFPADCPPPVDKKSHSN